MPRHARGALLLNQSGSNLPILSCLGTQICFGMLTSGGNHLNQYPHAESAIDQPGGGHVGLQASHWREVSCRPRWPQCLLEVSTQAPIPRLSPCMPPLACSPRQACAMHVGYVKQLGSGLGSCWRGMEGAKTAYPSCPDFLEQPACDSRSWRSLKVHCVSKN